MKSEVHHQLICAEQMIDFSAEYFFGESLQSLSPDHSDEAQRLLADLETCLEGTAQGMSESIILGRLAVFCFRSRDFKKACRAVHAFVREHISNAIKGVGKQTGRVILINELVQETTDEQLILSTATTAYAAGTDTSTITIATALFLLSRHPSALEKARAEVLAMTSGPPDIDTLKKMHYIRAVIDESKPSLRPDLFVERAGKQSWILADAAPQRCACIHLHQRVSEQPLMTLSYLQAVAQTASPQSL